MRRSTINRFIISDFINDPSFRFDVDFTCNVVSKNDLSYIRFTDLFDIVEKKAVDLESLNSPFKYCQIGDVDDGNNKFVKTIDFNEEKPELADYYSKIQKGDIFLPKQGDILLSKVRPYLKKIIRIEEKDIYYTTAFICLRPKFNSLLSYYFLYYLLNDDINIASRQGKGYPTIKEDDLIYLKIYKKEADLFYSALEKEALNKVISDKHGEISKLKNNYLDENHIIEKTFIEYFGFNKKKFDALNNQKEYLKPIAEIVNNIDMRFSTKFNRPAKEYLYKEEKNRGFIELKNILSEEGECGQSISPSDYTDESTDKYYISMADISSFYIDKEKLKNVSDSYYELNCSKKVQKNDLLITRSGEGGIGKVCFIDKEINAIFCDFIIRLKIDNRYLPKFIYYYIRTYLFQYFVETNKKGLGNNTNIFPNQIKYFLVPNIDFEEQKKICNKIDNLINENNKINDVINSKRKEIQTLIKTMNI